MTKILNWINHGCVNRGNQYDYRTLNLNPPISGLEVNVNISH